MTLRFRVKAAGWRFLPGLLLLAWAACMKQDPVERSRTLSELTRELSNSDVQWEGTNAGLMPRFTSDRHARVLAAGEQSLPELVAAMSDPDRFIAAHVLLTRLSQVEYGAFPRWNGLEVELPADGRVRVDPAQRFALAERWTRWYQASPRPKQLPKAP